MILRPPMHRSVRFSAIGALVATLSAVVAAPAYAEEHDPWAVETEHVELGVFAGVLRAANDHELFARGEGIPQRKYQALSFDVGARVGLYLLPFLGMEAEGALMPTSLRSDGSALLYRLGIHGILQYPARFSPFVVAGGGAYGVSSGDDVQGNDNDPSFYWGIGAKYFMTENFGLRIDGRQIFAPANEPRFNDTEEDESFHYEVLLGVAFAFGRHAGPPKDADGDGFKDPVDNCPNVKGVAPDGCPPRDTDGDGVMDNVDECPAIKGSLANGCPGDTDGDGVTDDKDECVDVAGPMANGCPDPDPDKDGILADKDLCPTVASSEPDGCPAADRDKDGIPDDQDKCPDVKGKGADGCPLDTDGDGIIDDNDQCIGQPETKNGYQDSDGCPDKVPEAVKKFTGTIQGITFDTGRSSIRSSSFTVLDGAVKVLKDFEDLKLEIGGHTDSVGRESTNLRLSQSRADAVRQYMIDKGIDGERLKAVGYGESKPKASNRTRAGRAENRRIDFTLID